jgi:hypothetical protein
VTRRVAQRFHGVLRLEHNLSRPIGEQRAEGVIAVKHGKASDLEGATNQSSVVHEISLAS